MTATERRKSELRKLLQSKQSGIKYTQDGQLIFKPINHWNKDPKSFKLPREADVVIISMEERDGMLVQYATDNVKLSPQQYEYILDVLRGRIQHLDAQPGANVRINLLEERYFAVDLICTLDI